MTAVDGDCLWRIPAAQFLHDVCPVTSAAADCLHDWGLPSHFAQRFGLLYASFAFPTRRAIHSTLKPELLILLKSPTPDILIPSALSPSPNSNVPGIALPKTFPLLENGNPMMVLHFD